MAYATKYILSFDNEINQHYDIYFDYLGYVGNAFPIIGAINAMILRSVAGDEDRFYPVLGTECLLNVFVGKQKTTNGVVDDSQLTIYDLIAQQDNQIRITVYKDNDLTKSFFQGFIVVEDNSQPFLDPPFVLSVRALDGLGLLKGVDFLDQLGNAFVGSMSPVQWIAQMLYKTGQVLNIRVYFNVINTVDLSPPPIMGFTLPVSTFQTGAPITTDDPTIDLSASAADDCYSVIEKIVRCLRCRIFQQDGVWNLVNIWEYQNPNGYTYTEYQLLDPVSGIVPITPIGTKTGLRYDVQVGYNQVVHPVQDDAVISLKLATKSEKLNYKYDQSLNKVCNQDLHYGAADHAHDGTISSTIQDVTIQPPVTFKTLGFLAFCYTHLDNTTAPLGADNATPYPASAPAKAAYIREVDDSLGYLFDRYLVIEKSTNPMTFLRTSPVLVDVADILQISFQWRLKDNVPPTGAMTFAAACVYLTGIDGTFWALACADDGNPTLAGRNWVQVDSNFKDLAGATRFCSTTTLTQSNLWTSVQINQSNLNLPYTPIPVSGSVEILFLCFQTRIGLGNEVWIKGIQVNILPYLQGSYKQLSGDFNFSSSNQDIKQTDEQTVEISDSPKRYFKGAILQTDGQSLMPPSWQAVGQDLTKVFRFTQLMELMIYNAIYRQFQKIEGTFRGTTWMDATYTVREVGFINSYFFSNHPVPTKKFMLTSYEIDCGTGYGRRVFVEILKDSNDTAQVDPSDPANNSTFIFQYLFNNS